MAADGGKRFGQGSRDLHLKPVLLENRWQGKTDVGLVVHEQEALPNSVPGWSVEPGPPFVCARFQNGIEFFNYGKKFVGISLLNGATGDFFPIGLLCLHSTHCRSKESNR